MHLDLHQPVAAAGLAAAALDIEGEAARAVAPGLRLRRRGEQVADVVEQARIGRRIGPRRPPMGLWSMSMTLSRCSMPSKWSYSPGPHAGPVQLAGQLFIEDLIDQAGFTGAGNAGHAGKRPQGDGDVDILQIVLPAAEGLEPMPVAAAPLRRDRDPPARRTDTAP